MPKEKSRPKHTTSCNDPSCTGCTTGEIQVALECQDGPLEASDILSAARQEASKTSLTEQDIDHTTHEKIVIKLYEQALEKFESTDENSLDYFSCLYELAMIANVPEYAQKAMQCLESYLSTHKEDFNAWLLYGRVLLEVAGTVLGNADEYDDHEAIVNEDEQRLVDKAIHSFEKAVKGGDGGDNWRVIASASLLEHALSQKTHHLPSTVVKKTLNACLSIAPSKERSSLASRTIATALFHLASFESHAKNPNLDAAMKNVKRSIELLESAVSTETATISDYQILGQAWLLLSSLETEDDDTAIDAFDAGAAALKKALELEPGNAHIRQQLADMQILDTDQTQCHSSII